MALNGILPEESNGTVAGIQREKLFQTSRITRNAYSLDEWPFQRFDLTFNSKFPKVTELYTKQQRIYRSDNIAMAAAGRNAIAYCEVDANGTVDINTLVVKRRKIINSIRPSDRTCKEGIIDSKQPTNERVLLRRIYFLTEERCRYISVGF